MFSNHFTKSHHCYHGQLSIDFGFYFSSKLSIRSNSLQGFHSIHPLAHINVCSFAPNIQIQTYIETCTVKTFKQESIKTNIYNNLFQRKNISHYSAGISMVQFSNYKYKAWIKWGCFWLNIISPIGFTLTGGHQNLTGGEQIFQKKWTRIYTT